MVREIILNDYVLKVTSYQKTNENGKLKISVDFKVTSEDYHDVTTLLYKGKFTLNVPDEDLTCKVKIDQYFTSVTNLYEKGQSGDFSLILLEVTE
ncbi:DUF3219 family protein [Fredinandcohnia sp. 179-A 10B2 NHS]|uniref:DUF3219 family protein n=1 Tax=Fredinandcohnia sp. 179-A 10B2 NHS TaxID=3235176 RepID=UPI0039A14F8B